MMSPPGAATVVDTSVLDELRTLDDGEGAVLKQLVGMFTASTPERIRKIQKAQAEGDFKIVNAEAHSLKSSAGNLGAQAMAALCQILENAKSAEAISQASESVRALDAEYEKVSRELLAYVSTF
jgi:HPt (histidine-containing phosphotransfer) domain-containing protein